MNFKRLYLCIITAALVTGCAGMSAEEKRQVQLLEDRVLLLQASMEETNAKLDDLSNKLILLHDKINSSMPEKKEEELKKEGNPAGIMPPNWLRVVNLDTNLAAANSIEASVKAGGTKAEKDSEVVEKATIREKAKPDVAEKAASETGLTAERLYSMAWKEYNAGRYEEARKLFLSIVDRFPNHGLADNALYWVGETYYTKKDFAKALEVFRKTADKYPEGNKAPDSLLKAAYSSMGIKDKEQAVDMLRDLVSRYPGTESAQKAKSTLDNLLID